MTDASLENEIIRLIKSFEAQRVFIHDLGTPRLSESDEFSQLVALGPQIIPYLLDLAKTEKPKVVAFIVSVLGALREASTLEALKELRARYQRVTDKTEWEYAIIGNCNEAIAAIEARRNN